MKHILKLYTAITLLTCTPQFLCGAEATHSLPELRQLAINNNVAPTIINQVFTQISICQQKAIEKGIAAEHVNEVIGKGINSVFEIWEAEEHLSDISNLITVLVAMVRSELFREDPVDVVFSLLKERGV